MLIFFHILIVIIMVEYCKLMLSDPVDPRVVDEQYSEGVADYNLLVFC